MVAVAVTVPVNDDVRAEALAPIDLLIERIESNIIIGGTIGGIIGVVILLLLYRLMVVGKILIFENLGVGTLPTPPN